MAHYARIQDGKVIDVHVVANQVITDAHGVEQEALGQQFLADLWGGDPSDYVQASYNRPNFRGGYPGVGWEWDGETFINPFSPDPGPNAPAA